MAIKTIEFEDGGQDFLEWDIDETGKVVACRPFQGFVWVGALVHLDTLALGEAPRITPKSGREMRLRYRVIRIEEAAR
ncbi:MAG: hypothetical protein AB1450_13375 [Pseudomonadota bacterium]